LVEDVEEAVFVRLYDHLARPAVDCEIGEHQLLPASKSYFSPGVVW
jgi:hypothetical protein